MGITIEREIEVRLDELYLGEGETVRIVLNRKKAMSVFLTVGKLDGVCFVDITSPEESRQRLQWVD